MGKIITNTRLIYYDEFSELSDDELSDVRKISRKLGTSIENELYKSAIVSNPTNDTTEFTNNNYFDLTEKDIEDWKELIAEDSLDELQYPNITKVKANEKNIKWLKDYLSLDDNKKDNYSFLKYDMELITNDNILDNIVILEGERHIGIWDISTNKVTFSEKWSFLYSGIEMEYVRHSNQPKTIKEKVKEKYQRLYRQIVDVCLRVKRFLDQY